VKEDAKMSITTELKNTIKSEIEIAFRNQMERELESFGRDDFAFHNLSALEGMLFNGVEIELGESLIDTFEIEEYDEETVYCIEQMMEMYEKSLRDTKKWISSVEENVASAMKKRNQAMSKV
jgi:hypothetical protein